MCRSLETSGAEAASFQSQPTGIRVRRRKVTVIVAIVRLSTPAVVLMHDTRGETLGIYEKSNNNYTPYIPRYRYSRRKAKRGGAFETGHRTPGPVCDETQ